MTKEEICQRIDAVCKTLDGGIVVSGVRNAGNLAGCFTILQETLAGIMECEIIEPKSEDTKSEG
jgi:hypothetical protein